MEHLLCVRYCCERFMYINSFTPHSTPIDGCHYPLPRWAHGTRGIARLSKVPIVMEQVNDILPCGSGALTLQCYIILPFSIGTMLMCLPLQMAYLFIHSFIHS